MTYHSWNFPLHKEDKLFTSALEVNARLKTFENVKLFSPLRFLLS